MIMRISTFLLLTAFAQLVLADPLTRAEAARLMPAPAAPVTPIPVGPDCVFTWTAPETPPRVDGYYVDVLPQGGTTHTHELGNVTTTTCKEAGARCGTYTVHVHAFNTHGASGRSNELVIQIDACPPAAPTDLSVK